jgi:hypothetical protein
LFTPFEIRAYQFTYITYPKNRQKYPRCIEPPVVWDRNPKNIGDVPGHRERGQGVYSLYDGSTPVYVGKGNIQARLRKENNKSKRLGNSWDHFSWFHITDQDEAEKQYTISDRTVAMTMVAVFSKDQ